MSLALSDSLPETSQQTEIDRSIWALMRSWFLTRSLLVKWIICTRSVSFSNHANQLFHHAFELTLRLVLIVTLPRSSNGQSNNTARSDLFTARRWQVIQANQQWCQVSYSSREKRQRTTELFLDESRSFILRSTLLALEWADDESGNGRGMRVNNVRRNRSTTNE